MKNRAQRRAEARKSSIDAVVTAVTVTPWYIRGPARLMVAVGAFGALVMIFCVAAELLS